VGADRGLVTEDLVEDVSEHSVQLSRFAAVVEAAVAFPVFLGLKLQTFPTAIATRHEASQQFSRRHSGGRDFQRDKGATAETELTASSKSGSSCRMWSGMGRLPGTRRRYPGAHVAIIATRSNLFQICTGRHSLRRTSKDCNGRRTDKLACRRASERTNLW